ncbi:MAG: HEAT repeat domain-containing protein [Planctomycetaceae bacterium]|nr:HEAT repeat domain-containing protein [Planctomycetaceae bacterium]
MPMVAASALRFLLSHCRPLTWLVIAVALLGGTASAATEQEIQATINRARQALLALEPRNHAEACLKAYALLKTGSNANEPAVQDAVRRVYEFPVAADRPDPQHHSYEAAVRLMFLEALDPVKHAEPIQAIAGYLISRQRGHGGWYYPNPPGDEHHDTSITQYALLGLWAALRAGAEIPTEVWENAARWHLSQQLPDGGYTYHSLDRTPSTMTMSTAGLANLRLIRMVLFGLEPATAVATPEGPKKSLKFNYLERRPDARPIAPLVETPALPAVKPIDLDRASDRALGWVTGRYDLLRADRRWFHYWLYGIERCGALLGKAEIGSHKWYEEGAEHLVRSQQPNGSWPITSDSQLATDSFGLLFLAKATSRNVPRQIRPVSREGGLLVGGRGLPDNLADLEIKNGEVKVRAPHGPLEELLHELEKLDVAAIPGKQAEIVASLPDVPREQLVGQIDLLVQLAAHPEPEVRRTAAWALGRSEDIRQARRLIDLLNDPDLDVAREASLALAALSRLPGGITAGHNPFAGLPPTATDDEKLAAASAWRQRARADWLAWYFRSRPYDERDDRLELNNRKRR